MSENINFDYITDYLRSLIKPREGLLKQIKEKAHKEESYVPIAEPETVTFLKFLTAATGAHKILEIGTGSAYTSISLALCGAEVVTIERYEKVYNEALKNIEKSGLSEKINAIFGDAADVLPTLEGSFDMIFLDAAKGQYINFLPQLQRLLKKGGILVSDNVLYKGMTAMEGIAVRRKVTIIKRLRKYLEEISENPLFITSVLPLGDGVAVSYKK